MTSDYTGFTRYASKMREDFWGNYGTEREILKRNLQEIAEPFDDPHPVDIYRGPNYEKVDTCALALSPSTIGVTNVPFPTSLTTSVLGSDPGIGSMEVGCTFIIR